MVLNGLIYKYFPKNVPLYVFNEKQIENTYSFLLNIVRTSVYTTYHNVLAKFTQTASLYEKYMHENSFEYIQKQFLFLPNPPSNQFLVLYNSFNGFHSLIFVSKIYSSDSLRLKTITQLKKGLKNLSSKNS